MARGAYLDGDLRERRTGHESATAGTVNPRLGIPFGMNLCLHSFSIISERASAKLTGARLAAPKAKIREIVFLNRFCWRRDRRTGSFRRPTARPHCSDRRYSAADAAAHRFDHCDD